MIFRLKQISRARGLSNFLLRLPVSQHLAEDDGVGEVAVFKVYIGEELVVEGGEKGLDVGFIEAGAFEDDDICGRKGPWEVTEIAVRAASSSS